MKKKELATVISQACIAPDIYDMWLETSLAKDANPGQFIAVYPEDGATLLPRPISICEINEEKTALRLVYRKAGKGTAEFSTYEEGQKVAVLGVLGNGFPLEAGKGKKVILMGGGIGVPPILQLAKELDADTTAVLGYRNNDLFLADDFKKVTKLVVATEDGSVGTKGNVLNAVAEENLEADVIMACGPMPMLRAIKTYAKEHNMKAYISLEERMACGVGACLGCVAKTKEIDHHSHVHNARICTDGPVFDAEDVEI